MLSPGLGWSDLLQGLNNQSPIISMVPQGLHSKKAIMHNHMSGVSRQVRRKACSALSLKSKQRSSKESACNAGNARDVSSNSGLGRSPRGGNGNPLQYSWLKNPGDGGAWWAYSPKGHKKLNATELAFLSQLYLVLKSFIALLKNHNFSLKIEYLMDD